MIINNLYLYINHLKTIYVLYIFECGQICTQLRVGAGVKMC